MYPGREGWYWIKFQGEEDLVRPAEVRFTRSSKPGQQGYLIACAGQIMYPNDIEAFWMTPIEKPPWEKLDGSQTT